MPNDLLKNLPCPNCGRIITRQRTDENFSCPNCGEELVWSTEGNKILLAHPLSTYLETGGEAVRTSEPWEKADNAIGLIDFRRRQATVEMSARWLGQRMATGSRTLKIGGGLLILCALLLGAAFTRTLFLGYVQIDAFISFIGASLFAPFGFFFFVWSLVERRSLSKYAARIREERRVLQEEAKTLSDKSDRMLIV